MNLPNMLTMSRIVLAPVFFLLLFIPVWSGGSGFVVCYILAWILFIYIEISDIFDGHLARSMGLVSDLGKLLDPFSDVVSRLTYFVAFVAFTPSIMPAWMFLIILYRELCITFLRTVLFNRGIAMAARKGGKLKAILYALAGGAGLVVIGARGFFPGASWTGILDIIVLSCFGLAVLVSFISFIDYIFVFIKLYRGSEKKAS